MIFCAKEFGKRLQTVRRQHFLRRNELARILETSAYVIKQIERGKTEPDSDLILNLFVFFKDDFHYLITGKHEVISRS